MSKQNNSKLHKAQKEKNDEFYTQLSDIERELKHYKHHFKDKIVFCNCDDPEWSEFYNYFHLNFEELGLKKLICTHYDREKPTYKLEITQDINGDGKIDGLDVVKTRLLQNGDFRSDECIELLKEADIVVTNPPFSLFREYVEQLIEYNKKFLIIGRSDAINYKNFFIHIKNNKIWNGYGFEKGNSYFRVPTDTDNGHDPNTATIVHFRNVTWWTNLDHNKRHEKVILWQNYYDENGNPLPDVEERYPHYDNFDAINIDKTKDIPCDYYGIMGVPTTFISNICPEQFEIIGITNHSEILGIPFTNNCFAEVNGKRKYSRILIKRKDI